MFWSSNFALPLHDVTIAMFRISESTDGLVLDVTLDLEDYCIDQKVNSSELSARIIQIYLNNNISFQFNKQEVSIVVVKDFTIVEDHIKINCRFENVETKIESINIQNTCLNSVAKHSNIIQLDLNDSFRDFRMHKGRTEIFVEY